MITGMYRANIGTFVQVREVWGDPDLFTLAWVESGNEDTITRQALEYMIRSGMFVRDYRRAS